MTCVVIACTPACADGINQAKQAQGWWLDQPAPGVLVWRLSHGRSYRVDPGCYPG